MQHIFTVEMTCSGCSNAVERALSRVQGIKITEISLETQQVVVETELSREDVLLIIQKTGKKVQE
ncbi:hypothetical protein BDF14DRAFT_1779994 [Spinellus fusiger]|nr:hypothetical protein BDF14DRAFT_1779994 [Spinellus fusiger]